MVSKDIKETLAEYKIDMLCGGFPCQPVSRAGLRRDDFECDERWLWPEFFRIICILRPQIVLAENTPGLFDRGLDIVLRDFAKIGYDAIWFTLRASDYGFPQKRERIFIVAYPKGKRLFASQIQARKFIEGLQQKSDSERNGGLFCELRRGNSGRIFVLPDPKFYRMVDGIPDWVDRLKSLGNAIVPQVAYEIMKAIKEIEIQK